MRTYTNYTNNKNLLNKKLSKVVLYALYPIFLAMPAAAYAITLVPAGCRKGGGSCGFNELIELIGNLMNFAIILAPLIAAAAFALAGFYYITAGGDPGKISKAHDVFTTTIIGLVIVLAAWFVVKAIVIGLGAQGFVTNFVNF